MEHVLSGLTAQAPSESEDGAIRIAGNGCLDTVSSDAGQRARLWGNGNAIVGIGIDPGCTLVVADSPALRPTVTAVAGASDFGFWLANGGGLLQLARQWNDATAAWSDAGGPPTRATTWNNFSNANFAFAAQSVPTNAAIMGL